MPISINLFYNHLKEDNMSIGSMSRYLLRNCVAEIRSLMSGGVQIVPLLECRLPMGASALCAWLQGGICGSKVENFDHRRVSKLNLFDLEQTNGKDRHSKYNFKAFTSKGLYMLERRLPLNSPPTQVY